MKPYTAIIAILLPASLFQGAGDGVDYRSVHFRALFVDTHNDVETALYAVRHHLVSMSA